MKPNCCHLLLILVLPTIVGCPNSDSGKSDPVTTVDSVVPLELQALKNRSLAAMENKHWGEAIAGFKELSAALPDSRLAQRNHAICHVLSLIDITSSYKRSSKQERAEFDVAAQAARSAIVTYQSLIKDKFDQALAKLLLGKLLVRMDEPEKPTLEQGLVLLREATTIVPNRADFAYAVVRAMETTPRYANIQNPGYYDRLQQLKVVHRMNPDNLYVVLQLLSGLGSSIKSPVESVQQEAAALPEILQVVREKLAPFYGSMKKRNRFDLKKIIDQALNSDTSNSLMALYRPSQVIPNLMKTEIATTVDRRRIDRDLLEYVLTEFEMEIGQPTITNKWEVNEFVKSLAFENVTGISHVQVVDIDLNGVLDFAVLQDGRFRVYTPSSDGQSLNLMFGVSEDAPIASGFVLADIDRDYDQKMPDFKAPQLVLDRDGDIKLLKDPTEKRRWYDVDFDVVTWGPNGIAMFRNTLDENGNRGLEFLEQDLQLTSVQDATPVDFDMDGDLDFALATDVGITFLRNLDGTQFEEANSVVGQVPRSLVHVSSIDWDRNLAPDVIAISDVGETHFLQNLFHSRFRWLKDEPAIEQLKSTGQLAFADLNADRSWDLIHSGPEGLKVVLTKRMGEVVEAASTLTLSESACRDVQTGDFDNDGLTDIAVIDEQGVAIFQNQLGRFSAVNSRVDCPNIRSFDISDDDNDGDLDIVVATDNGLFVYANQGGDQNHYLKVVARGKPDDSQHASRRVNAHGVNAILEVRCGNAIQIHLIKDPVVHVGLGPCEKPDSLRIIWTDGIPQHVRADQFLRPNIGILAPQILKGSCPYVYTWNGSGFQFFSDCLWAAPIGLVQANGELAPTREWENLLIPGYVLRERKGVYEIQLTEELWEIAYFDQVKLTAIDHPVDVDVFTNEKVGPPTLARHRVHTVGNRRYFDRIVDGQGRDHTLSLAQQDGVYMQPFESRVLQGLTQDWTLEMEAKDLKNRGSSLRLFLTGWIFPTDTSLNQQIFQNRNLQPPLPPVVEVPDGDGGWKVVKPFIGFPSGKTKTMVVDLSNLAKDGLIDRFRLRSSMELYFDEIFYSVESQDAQTQSQACQLQNADLHFRGFSRRVYDENSLFRGGAGPEDYDYAHVTIQPRWPPIAGRFTGYGDTTPLLQQHDDRMIVMGPGDEITLRFQVPERPVPAGWKRNFILHNVGYDKDADLNTVYGQSSEPLPRKAMPVYPYLPEEVTNSTEYQQYKDQWQTRTYDKSAFWNDSLRE